MLLTLALVVLCASIAVFFSQEFIYGFKKLFAIKGMSLLLPLFIATYLVFTFDYWALWTVYYYREMLQIALGYIVGLLPFHEYAESVALIIFLTAISVIPVFLVDFFLRKRTYRGYQYPNVTSFLILLVSALLLVL